MADSKFEYNMNIPERDRILWGEFDSSVYENEKEVTPGYNDASVQILEKLMNMHFINPEGSHDGSPKYKDYLAFLKRHPDYFGIGSITSSRMTIDGVEKKGFLESQEELDDLAATFPEADIFRLDTENDENGNPIENDDPRVLMMYSHF